MDDVTRETDATSFTLNDLPRANTKYHAPFLQKRGFCLKGNACDFSHIKLHMPEGITFTNTLNLSITYGRTSCDYGRSKLQSP